MSKHGMRSLVCDGSGIIVAEMVYRCMICAKIHEVLDEAQNHYHQAHMNDEDEEPARNNEYHNNSNNLARQQHYEDNSDYEDEDLNFTAELTETLPDGTPIFEEAPSPGTSLTVVSGNSDGYSRAKPITFASPANTLLMPLSNSSGSVVTKQSPARKVGGGFVTCEVCGLTKYYSHISRRYGVFSCESCAKFFYRYLLKPAKFTCTSNGNCSLKIDVPGGRCKSCLLQACLQKYIIDPKKHPKIFQKSNDNNMLGANSFSSMQVKVTKAPPKTSPAVQPTKAALKQEYQPDSRDSSDSNDQNSLNGVVVKMSASAAKRKQQLEEALASQGKTRRGGCRECPGCLADDCGQCLYCLDKPKFGGLDVKKQRCIRRRCHRS